MTTGEHQKTADARNAIRELETYRASLIWQIDEAIAAKDWPIANSLEDRLADIDEEIATLEVWL